jgi:DNA-binding transcriptional LysR family regulator
VTLPSAHRSLPPGGTPEAHRDTPDTDPAPGDETGPPGDASARSWVRVLCPMLEVLAAVAEEQHLTRAADRLGLPQPTVSRTIARIERRLGVSVLDRRGRGVRLTPAGKVIADGAGSACLELERASRVARDLADPGAGTVRLAYPYMLSPAIVPRLVRSWIAANPHSRVWLSQAGPEQMLVQLAQDEVDLVIISPLPHPRGRLLASPLLREPWRLVVPADHRLAGRGTARLREVAGDPFVMPSQGLGLHTSTVELCRHEGFTPVAAFEGNDLAILRGLVGAGLGVAVLPADPDPAPEVVELVLDQGVAQRTVGLAWRTGAKELPVVRRFREFLLAQAPGLLAEPGPR